MADLLFSVENLFVLAGGFALLGIVLTAAGWGGVLGFVALELTELLSRVDSVPGVFAITDHPLVVLASNVFALAGLRWVGDLGRIVRSARWPVTSS